MKIKIDEKQENPLLERKELKVLIEHPGEPTPSEKELRSKISAQQDLDPKKVVIDTIKSSFGVSSSKAYIRILEEIPEDLEEKKEVEEETKEGEAEEIESSEKEESEESLDEDESEKPEESEGVEKEVEEESPKEEKIDYEEIVDNSISDAKEELESLKEVDYEKLLEAESKNKARKTFTDWIKSQMED